VARVYLAAAAFDSAVCEAPDELADVNRPDLGVVVLGPTRTRFPGDSDYESERDR
jgi:hypothetical protein